MTEFLKLMRENIKIEVRTSVGDFTIDFNNVNAVNHPVQKFILDVLEPEIWLDVNGQKIPIMIYTRGEKQ